MGGVICIFISTFVKIFFTKLFKLIFTVRFIKIWEQV